MDGIIVEGLNSAVAGETTPLLDSGTKAIDTTYYWGLLGLTIAMELVGTVCMQLSDGFANFWPSVGIFVGYGIAFSIFPFALQGIDLSVAYAVWSSTGIALTTVWGYCFAGETVSPLKVACISGILVSVAGLKHAEGVDAATRAASIDG